jgi:hypothetical protein
MMVPKDTWPWDSTPDFDAAADLDVDLDELEDAKPTRPTAPSPAPAPSTSSGPGPHDISTLPASGQPATAMYEIDPNAPQV